MRSKLIYFLLPIYFDVIFVSVTLDKHFTKIFHFFEEATLKLGFLEKLGFLAFFQLICEISEYYNDIM